MKQFIVSTALLLTSLSVSFFSNASSNVIKDHTGKIKSRKNTASATSTSKSRIAIAVYSKDETELIGYASFINADELPESVTGILEKKYTDYRVAGKVVEVSYSDSLAYVFTIENEKEILNLRIEGKSSLILSRLEKM